MSSAEKIEALREHLSHAVAEQLSRANVDWRSVEQLTDPILCIEAKFHDRSSKDSCQPPPGLTISQVIDLTGVITPKFGTPCEPRHSQKGNECQGAEASSGRILPSAPRNPSLVSQEVSTSGPRDSSRADDKSDYQYSYAEKGQTNSSRKAISGLRPSWTGVPIIEDNTQRQMQIANANFPKRRKVDSTGYTLKPSSLDKLIVGIWEQIHGGLSIDPEDLLGQVMSAPILQGIERNPEKDSHGTSCQSLIHSSDSSMLQSGHPFSHTNIVCQRVTQASRTCRSIEVIVQARWVEHFDSYVEHLKANGSKISDTKHRKAALVEACSDFGWSEKELRNKMGIWRGYKEIKDAGGWAALVFAGMGIYRFCKYRIGFDEESMQRLQSLRPALEVAADTLHPNWRQLLSIINEPSQRVYRGHPHDWVVYLDGSLPAPLHTTYLQWDPYFNFKHIDECVVDECTWGCEDPRWAPPSSAVARISPLSVCETCGKEQSDDPKLNSCYCFPSLFGCPKLSPSPVQVFRTPNGRSNGLMALGAFERGAAIGEFVGMITKGLQEVDVMESTRGSTNYQIWQGRQGNFTRFINHSCNANAQYQRFTWLGTQRIILVSKGIDPFTEITVDYSDKYWKGLDKKCLCGEKSCRYR